VGTGESAPIQIPWVWKRRQITWLNPTPSALHEVRHLDCARLPPLITPRSFTTTASPNSHITLEVYPIT
jgi:hypothetical protein